MPQPLPIPFAIPVPSAESVRYFIQTFQNNRSLPYALCKDIGDNGLRDFVFDHFSHISYIYQTFSDSRLRSIREYVQQPSYMKFHISANNNGPFTNTRPNGYIINCWRLPFNNWQSLLLDCLRIIYLENPTVFRSLIGNVVSDRRKNGTKRQYFAEKPELLSQKPVNLGLEFPFFVETCLSANNIHALIEKICLRLSMPFEVSLKKGT